MVNTDADNNRFIIMFNCVPKQILKQSGDAFRVTRYPKLIGNPQFRVTRVDEFPR